MINYAGRASEGDPLQPREQEDHVLRTLHVDPPPDLDPLRTLYVDPPHDLDPLWTLYADPPPDLDPIRILYENPPHLPHSHTWC